MLIVKTLAQIDFATNIVHQADHFKDKTQQEKRFGCTLPTCAYHMLRDILDNAKPEIPKHLPAYCYLKFMMPLKLDIWKGCDALKSLLQTAVP